MRSVYQSAEGTDTAAVNVAKEEENEGKKWSSLRGSYVIGNLEAPYLVHKKAEPSKRQTGQRSLCATYVWLRGHLAVSDKDAYVYQIKHITTGSPSPPSAGQMCSVISVTIARAAPSHLISESFLAPKNAATTATSIATQASSTRNTLFPTSSKSPSHNHNILNPLRWDNDVKIPTTSYSGLSSESLRISHKNPRVISRKSCQPNGNINFILS